VCTLHAAKALLPPRGHSEGRALRKACSRKTLGAECQTVYTKARAKNPTEKDPQSTVLPKVAQLLRVPFLPSPGVHLLASLGSASGAADRDCAGICPWDAALLVPSPKLQATGSDVGADATCSNCSLAAPWGARLRTVPRCKHCCRGKGRGAFCWTPLFALVWEQCVSPQGRRVQCPMKNLHEQYGKSSVVGLPGWPESGAMPAGKTQAAGTPSRRIRGCVSVGNDSSAKSHFSRLPPFLSQGGQVGARAAAAWLPPPSKWGHTRSDLDLSRQA